MTYLCINFPLYPLFYDSRKEENAEHAFENRQRRRKGDRRLVETVALARLSFSANLCFLLERKRGAFKVFRSTARTHPQQGQKDGGKFEGAADSWARACNEKVCDVARMHWLFIFHLVLFNLCLRANWRRTPLALSIAIAAHTQKLFCFVIELVGARAIFYAVRVKNSQGRQKSI